MQFFLREPIYPAAPENWGENVIFLVQNVIRELSFGGWIADQQKSADISEDLIRLTVEV